MFAAKEIERLDLRRQRAAQMVAAIMPELDDVLPLEYDRRAVHDRLAHVLEQNGACWTTDKEREALGFEPRDDMGWTATERVAVKQRELNAIQLLCNVAVDKTLQEAAFGGVGFMKNQFDGDNLVATALPTKEVYREDPTEDDKPS